MSKNALETLVDDWLSEPVFRQAMLIDPEGTIRQGGLQLDELTWSVVRCLDWSLPAETLKSLLHKVGLSIQSSSKPEEATAIAPPSPAAAAPAGDSALQWELLEGLYKLYETGTISTEKYSHLLSKLIQTCS